MTLTHTFRKAKRYHPVILGSMFIIIVAVSSFLRLNFVTSAQTENPPQKTASWKGIVRSPNLPNQDTASFGLDNGNFESGATGWTQYSNNSYTLITNSFPGGITAHGGSWAVWLGGADNEIDYIQQQVTVPASKPTLTFWYWIASADTCGFDIGKVVVNSTTVTQYDLCQSNNTDGWLKQSIDLTSYAGQSITLQIRAETDISINSNIFIDDVSFPAEYELFLPSVIR